MNWFGGPLRGLALKSNTIIFTICVMKLKVFQRIPTFFQLDGIDCLEQTKSSHIGEKVHEMTKMWVL
jgi:hypothetical protein